MSARSVRLVPIRELVLLRELSPRFRLTEDTITRYMESFAALPPVVLQRGTRVVIDGYHRVEAAVRLGLEAIPAVEEAVSNADLRLAAGLSNAAHGQPLAREERNRLAVTLVRDYGRLREDAAKLLGMSAPAVTMALREHQLNEELSRRMGVPVQVINSTHVRALYRVAPDQRERLLEVVVSKLDEQGRPHPLTGAELRALVDRMLDPATPPGELHRLLNDPLARPRPAPERPPGPAAAPAPPAPPPSAPSSAGGDGWRSPLLDVGPEDRERVAAVDEFVQRRLRPRGGSAERDRPGHPGGPAPDVGTECDPPGRPPEADSESRGEEFLREGIHAAARALEAILPGVEPPSAREELGVVLYLLRTLLEERGV